MKKARDTEQVEIHRLRDGELLARDDLVVAEEPLEMKVEYGPVGDRKVYTLAITMRTPGSDEHLIRGFLLTEGIIDHANDIVEVQRPAFALSEDQSITAILTPDVKFDPSTQQRHFYTTSSCGVCGKASIDMVRQVSPYRTRPGEPVIKSKALYAMLEELRRRQAVFDKTGGIHAAAFFNMDEECIHTAEDVGRHNAVDKLIGLTAKMRKMPFDQLILLVSGRAGFELVQKAAVTGVAVFAAVGAPSSLAVELARERDMTLVGFLKEDSFNIYSCPERVLV